MLTKYVIASSTGDTYGSVSSSQWLRQVRLIRVPRLVDQLGQIHVPVSARGAAAGLERPGRLPRPRLPAHTRGAEEILQRAK
jgi:hypothetical protein